jgi:hypothetical protein
MSAHLVLVSIWQQLVGAPDEATAESLIRRLDDPFLRAQVRTGWREYREASVTTIGGAA